MLAVLQRVRSSAVSVHNEIIGEIGPGFNILLGVFKGDRFEDCSKIIKKLIHLRVFADAEQKMNRSLLDIEGQCLVISQFTLAGDVRKGRRPSFDQAESPGLAKDLYTKFVQELKKYVSVATGEFGAMMDVQILNDGPVTFILDSKKLS